MMKTALLFSVIALFIALASGMLEDAYERMFLIAISFMILCSKDVILCSMIDDKKSNVH